MNYKEFQRKHCTTKVRYRTQKKAIRAAGRRRVSLTTYPCNQCGGWHLSSQPKRRGALA